MTRLSPPFGALALLALLGPASALAGKNTPHDPKKFAEYSSTSYFELAMDLKYTERRGIGVLIEQGLRAGRYEAKSQDEAGYYFFGEASSVCQAASKCGDFDMEGGIWMSKKDARDVRIFMVQNPPTGAAKDNVDRSGVIVRALVRKDIGKVFIFPPNESLATDLARMLRQTR